MRKFILSTTLVLVVVASLGVGIIYAQDGEDEETDCENLITVITDTLGMTTEELQDALADGQTLSEIAEAQGVSANDLAVAIGTYQLECGPQLRGNRPGGLFGERGDRFGGFGPFGGDRLGGRDFGPLGGRGGDRFGLNMPLIQAISDATGLSAEEIVTMLREDDLTLAQIINENGGDVDAIIADLVAQYESNLTDWINGVDSSDTDEAETSE